MPEGHIEAQTLRVCASLGGGRTPSEGYRHTVQLLRPARHREQHFCRGSGSLNPNANAADTCCARGTHTAPLRWHDVHAANEIPGIAYMVCTGNTSMGTRQIARRKADN